MNCAHFLMGCHSFLSAGKKIISYKIDEYMTKTEKTLLDNLEFMIFIAGAYDEYKHSQVSANTIHNLLNITDDEVLAVYYENIMKHKYLGEIYQYIYTNRDEILELSKDIKYYLNIVYNSGVYMWVFTEFNDIIKTYKEKDYTGYNKFFIDGLIEFYGDGSFKCKLRPF